VTNLPCPFCGCKEIEVFNACHEYHSEQPRWLVYCRRCEAQTHDYNATINAALNRWNTRITFDELEHPIVVASGDTENIWGYDGND
jgi:Lar family restriction alleviation protein